MLQNTLHIFVARFTEALLKSMECELKTPTIGKYIALNKPCTRRTTIYQL